MNEAIIIIVVAILFFSPFLLGLRNGYKAAMEEIEQEKLRGGK